ncbi:DUF3891 family protein [Algoriphagus persicinus]|uniref:DUF3891 family protein n=1 Tax=Algoriphagus persicinus TaxID=3108754 RepID=UPI002B38F08E|nr:DUF3891 family protein [Algoriphagus sp. E1-3-M2]MEB2785453.1 DUF3891 family protein [Algoriphagus sp. E1-3-M2]
MERENLTGSGAPLDYRQQREVNLEQAKSVVQSVKYKSSFIVLMVSAHFHKLYDESKDLEVQKFLENPNSSCDEIILHLGLQKDEVAQCFQFLKFCDDLSLFLCQNDIENHKNPVEIDPNTGQEKIYLPQLSNGELLVSQRFDWIQFGGFVSW